MVRWLECRKVSRRFAGFNEYSNFMGVVNFFAFYLFSFVYYWRVLQ